MGEGLSSPVRVMRGLGRGGQGEVFEADYGGERVALKWYFPAVVRRDQGLQQRLRDCIRATSPSDAFLWPFALLIPTADCRQQLGLAPESCGYLMAIRPPQFLGAHEHGGGHLSISLRNVLRACFFLADGFHALHSKGLCYKDISLGNLFLSANDGRILICDNDNVEINGRNRGAALGTPGFMAPEVLLGQAKPSSSSDLFSLAVLLFRLLTRHDPFKGQRELAIRCLDEPARRRLYGEDPLFIFDPSDDRNRPDPLEHPAPLVTWPIYPAELQALFVQTLGRQQGLRAPERRTLTGQWTAALAATLDRRCLCPQCGQEVFPAPGQAGLCWHCGANVPAAARLRGPQGSLALQPENELHRHHLDPLASEKLDQPLAVVESHPQDPSILGLKNLSGSPWTVELHSGESIAVSPGQRCNLSLVRRLHTPLGALELMN